MLLPSTPFVVLQAFEVLPFGFSVASAVLCQVPENTDVEYKQRSMCFLSLLPTVN